MKYVSIDIETTGLDPNTNQVLEIGLVVEDTEVSCPVSQLPSLRILIPRKDYTINTFCMKMHEGLLTVLDAVDWPRLRKEDFYQATPGVYYSKPDTVYRVLNHWFTSGGGQESGMPRKPVVAGKNFFGFDNKFLEKLPLGLDFHHRSLDPAILYMRPEDEAPPGIPLCVERAGLDLTGYHTSIGDANTVIELLRSKGIGAE